MKLLYLVGEYCDFMLAMALIRLAQFLCRFGLVDTPLFLIRMSDKIRDKYLSAEELQKITERLRQKNQSKN